MEDRFINSYYNPARSGKRSCLFLSKFMIWSLFSQVSDLIILLRWQWICIDNLWWDWGGSYTSIAALLYLSAAFDTINIVQLYGLGVGGVLLQWFFSFLQGQFQLVTVEGLVLDPCCVECFRGLLFPHPY